ncbi:hypothetical protein [Actinomadura decatromicini]|uniref:DUF8129 domain-containing protein n=1 Tax=Actinomadura decatromicini TaxID=2604572 RepID=A0A5D3FLU6_9ACTN|nr:hypothetical protein [Actinomadura decatromicini]TYK49271.1 hypothetical protein FXF68_15880 [Actinomadura decatromicini]
MTRSPRRLKEQLQDTVGEQVRDLPLHAVRLAMFGVGRALLLGDRVTRDYKEITEGGGVRPVLDRLRDDVQGTAEKVVGRVVERVRGDEREPEPEPEPEPASAPRAKVAEPPARPKPRPAPSTDEISVGKPGGGAEAGGTAGTRHTPKHARPGPPPKPAKPGALGRHHAKPAPSPEPAGPKPEPAPQAEPTPSPKPADTTEPKPAADKPKPAEAPKAADKPKAAGSGTKAEGKAAGKAKGGGEAAKLPVPDYDNATLPQLRARLRGLSADQVRLLREYEREHAAREDVVRMYERRIAKLNGHG